MSGSVTFDSCVRGYHVYKDLWNPCIGDTLLAKPEFGNLHDPYAVAVVTSNDTIVGHLPRNISTLCHIFLRRSGNIVVQITDKRKYSSDLPQGGLEVPCSLIFVGESEDLLKIEKLKCAVPASLPIAVEPPKKRAKIDLCSEKDADLLDKSEGIWLKFDGVCLTEMVKQELVNGNKLNDRHINYAQRMLHSQFPDVEGLGHTLLQKRRSTKKIQCGLQIIHDRGDHWIVAANIGSDDNTVQVYDSVYTLVEENTREVILNLFHLSDNPVIEIAKMHKQRGAKECRLFAIAVATNILSGISTLEFQEQQMRSHLLSCYQNNMITQFP